MKPVKAIAPEAALLAQILELAAVCGWKTAHFRPGRTAKGWRTAVQGNGRGWPDLVLVHRARRLLVFAELKSDAGEPTTEQLDWLDVLGDVPGVIVRLWRPADWPEIERVLMGP